MTGALSPDLAVAYVRELSADVRGVVALGPDGELLVGPEVFAAPARRLAARLEHGIVRLPEGLALVARGPRMTIVVAAGRHALPGPHALDAAAAAGAGTAPAVVPEPPESLCSAARDVISAT
jgi:hypothetical protein